MTNGPSLEWYADVPRSTRRPTLMGYGILGVAVLGFGYWATTAPIAGAIIASGVFVTTSQNKIIQHLEGGVIRDLLVREGAPVEPRQVLMRLDDTSPKAELQRLRLRHARLAAIEARLQAEANEDREVSFPSDLTSQLNDPDIITIVETQRLTFTARRNNLMSELAALQEGINALEERVAGGRIQLTGVQRQLGLFQEELDAKSTLLKGGLIRKSEVLALQRAYANAEGEIGRLTGEMGDTRDRIARAREQMKSTRHAAIKTASEQLHEARAELNDVRERLASAKGVLDRIEITAPVKGVVVKMRYNTPGGVVEPGKSIMEIVPVGEDLIIEVRVRPQDIEHVKVGSGAGVRLTALNRRVVPIIAGSVVYLSADALPDEKARQQGAGDVYIARIRLDADEVSKVQGFEPTPGMPAEVYIKTSERTFIDYLLRPLKDTMSRAFREL